MFAALLRTELLVWFRTKENLFWAMIWPVMWLVLVWGVFPALPGRTKPETLEHYYPSGIVLVLFSASLTSLAIKLALAKEQNELRRLTLTPMPLRSFFLAQVAASGIGALIAVAVITATGYALGVRVRGSIFSSLVVTLLGLLTFSALAFFIAGISNRVGKANLISMLVMFAMMFLSNVFFDLSMAPPLVRTIAGALPGSPLCQALRDIMFDGGGLSSQLTNLAVLGGWASGASALSLATFRMQ